MANPVKLSGKSDLSEILKDLDALRKKMVDVQQSMKKGGKQVNDELQDNTNRMRKFFTGLRAVSAQVSQRIKEDFKSLLALNAISESMKLSEQFKGSIRQAITLNDVIRKNGRSLGIMKDEFGKFQTFFTKGLAEIGASSEAGSMALEELVKTPVRGQENLLEYAKTAAMLSSISNKPGSEGEVAGGLSRVIQARGGDVNDLSAMREVAESVKKAMVATGSSASEIISSMEKLYTPMSADFRKKMGPQQLGLLSAGAAAAGPNSTAFLEEFMAMSREQRAGLEARGIGNLFKADGGFDVEAIKRFGREAKNLGSGNLRLGMRALGVQSDEAAEGAIRLVESIDRVAMAQDAYLKDNEKLAKQYRESMTLGESFRANINRIKRVFAGPISFITEGLTDAMSKASESDVGAAGTVLGGGVLAALLAGIGLRGVGGALGKGAMGGIGGTVLKGAAAEAITGKETIPVYVTNAAEIAGMGAAGNLLGGGGLKGKAGTILGNAGNLLKRAAPMALRGAGAVAGVGAAAYGGYQLGDKVINPALDKGQITTDEGFKGNAIEALLFKIDKLFNTERYQQFQKSQEVFVRLTSPELKETTRPGRGAAY